jgi:hypothetical protein
MSIFAASVMCRLSLHRVAIAIFSRSSQAMGQHIAEQD